jgi:hypothetical protein
MSVALLAAGLACGPASAAPTVAGGTDEAAWASCREMDERDDFVLLSPREMAVRRACKALRDEVEAYLEHLPAPLRQEWLQTFRDAQAAENLLYAQMRKERDELEDKVFGDIATLLELPTIKDLFLHTDLMTGRNGRVAKRSASIERLTDFIRRGQEVTLRNGVTQSALDYVDHTRVNRSGVPDTDWITGLKFARVVKVVSAYDAATKVKAAIAAKFDDASSPAYLRAAIESAARTELRFAMLEAVRRGDIGVAHYDRLRAAIEADDGGKAELKWTAHVLRIGAEASLIPGMEDPMVDFMLRASNEMRLAAYTSPIGRAWLFGQTPHLAQLPVFTLRLAATGGAPATDFVYAPGHPDGALRSVPRGARASSLIVPDIKGQDSRPEILGWLASRMPPEDFSLLLAEFEKGKRTGKPPAAGASRVPRALQEEPRHEPNALTRWLGDRLNAWLKDSDPPHVPEVALARGLPDARKMRFMEAVVASQAARARSTATPRFESHGDADVRLLARAALGVLDESLSIVMLPFPARGLVSVQLLGYMGIMAHRTGSYLSERDAGIHGTAELVADFVDFSLGLALGAGASKLSQQRLARMSPLVYRPPGGKRRLWFDFDTRRRATSLPEGAVQRDDVFVKGEERFVKLKTRDGERVVRVVPDGPNYRLGLDGGGMGPLVRRRGDGAWKLSSFEKPADVAELAALLLEGYTTDAATLAQARRMLRQFGLQERHLLAMGAKGGLPGPEQVALGAVGHGFLETQLARLRDMKAGPFTPREVSLLLPAMARQVGRPLALEGEQGAVEWAVLADGGAVGADQVPANALRVRRSGRRYVLPGRGGGATRDYPTVFAAVEAGSRTANDRSTADATARERAFRAKLADTLAGRSMRPQLERLHRLWIDPLPVPERQRQAFKEVSFLRQALFDRHHAMTAKEEHRLLGAVRDLMPAGRRVAIEVRELDKDVVLATFGGSDEPRIVLEAVLAGDGSRTAYFGRDEHGLLKRPRPVDESFAPVIDVLLNTGGGKVREALGMGEWEWRRFADRIIARVVDDEDALLPRGLHHLVVKDKAILASARRQAADRWLDGVRHYARLRDLAGRTQVVEIALTAADGNYEILAPPGRPGRDTGRFITQRDGKWYPTGRLRGGMDPIDGAGRSAAARALRARLPAGASPDAAVMERILDAIPQPLLQDVALRLESVAAVPAEGLVLTLRDRYYDTVWTYRLLVDLQGHALNTVRPHLESRPRAGTPVSRYQQIASAASTHSGQGGVVALDHRVRKLMSRGAPISEFIPLGTGESHIQALIDARRLRGMLAEDDRMAVVATVGGHAFTLVLPIDERTVATREWASVAELPAGARIVDSFYGIAVEAADYAERVRALASGAKARRSKVQALDADGMLRELSAGQFAEQILSSRVRVNTWTPLQDPISELNYVEYIRYRHENRVPRAHAGLDWLLTRAARRDYTKYFAPPFNEVPAVVQEQLDRWSAESEAPMATLLAEARRPAAAPASGRPAAPATVTAMPPPVPSITHEEAVTAFRQWMEGHEGATKPPEDDWDFDASLLDDDADWAFDFDLLGPET